MRRLLLSLAAVVLWCPTSWAQNPTCPTRPPGDSSNACASTAFAQGAASNPAAPVVIGALPFVQAFNYAAGANMASLLAVRGTTAAPITDNQATAIFQSVSSETTGTGGTTLYASLVKRSTQAAIDSRAAWFEFVDAVGGGSGSGMRAGAFCVGGTGGNCSGATNLAIATVPYSFLIGAENQAWNNTGTDATTTFSAAKFAAPMLSSCAGTNKCDAGFLINPNSTVQDINGVYAASGTISDSFLRADGTINHGLNLTNATCTTDCYLGPSGNGKITGAGVVVSGVTTVSGLPSCVTALKGGRMFVTDATQTFASANYGGTLTGGGANNVPVVCDGTNWRMG